MAGSGGSTGGGGGGGHAGPRTRRPDFPLRILVSSDMVGAIIGRSGNTIRYITEETRARVDVHRKENTGSSEKVITIYGNPDNCSKACEKILHVMQMEANNTNRSEVPLKILAHNCLIGRVIGKNGATIKRIMEQTNTKITVSNNIHDVGSFNMERVIEIRGRPEDICAAEVLISCKLRTSYESDLATMTPQMPMFPGLHPMAMMSSYGPQVYPPSRSGAPGPGPSSYGIYGNPSSYIPPVMPYGTPPPPPLPLASGPGGPTISSSDQAKETVYLCIPNAAVGAIIGTGGSTIREMMSSSGASIKVAQPPKDEKGPTLVQTTTPSTPSGAISPSETQPQQQQSQSPQLGPQASPSSQTHDRPNERKITIIGTPEAQWKAQFMIFRKVGYEGGPAGPQEAVLKVEIMVPSNQVGRIIGKGGATVRELQLFSHAIIKLPEEGQSSSSEETPVHIIGDFLSTQAAQRQIRALVMKGSLSSAGSGGGGRSRGKSTQSPTHPNHQHPLPGDGSSAPSPSYQKPQEAFSSDELQPGVDSEVSSTATHKSETTEQGSSNVCQEQ
ncbi:IGF-II mRNA-binding protein isoform X2 [Brevipalpus obovatus]|uniref:IGF-II mRNA-binding protein isoform X2 n=1 Tax=Brevipalpus obovatus TaxID=246614 RepID=UPI003D9FB0C6